MLKALPVRTSQDGDEEYVTGNWKKWGPCYIVAGSSAELSSELVSDDLGQLVEISKQSIEGTVWYLLAAFSKM